MLLLKSSLFLLALNFHSGWVAASEPKGDVQASPKLDYSKLFPSSSHLASLPATDIVSTFTQPVQTFEKPYHYWLKSHCPQLTAEPLLEAIRQKLIDMDIDREKVAQADGVKLEKWEHISSFLPEPSKLVSSAGIKSVKCELCWFLGIIEFDEAIKCIRRSSILKGALDERTLVNAFADRHAFELEQIAIESGALVADEAVLQRHVKDLRSLEGIPQYEAHFILLQHSLGLLERDPQSAELRDMCRNLMTLHLSSTFSQKKGVLSAIYAELKPDVPTLLYASLPGHAAVVSVTLRQDATYDVVLINSGSGIGNHHIEYLDSTKGFHKANVMGALPVAFVPTIEFKGVTKEQLSKAGYHFGKVDQVYYKDQPEVRAIKKRHVMPWELTDSQGIGSCTFSSVWYALRFYYEALVFENDLRLSLLEQAISETVKVQADIQKLVHKLDADYAERRQIAGKNVPYYSETVKAIWNEKDELEGQVAHET